MRLNAGVLMELENGEKKVGSMSLSTVVVKKSIGESWRKTLVLGERSGAKDLALVDAPDLPRVQQRFPRV